MLFRSCGQTLVFGIDIRLNAVIKTAQWPYVSCSHGDESSDG